VSLEAAERRIRLSEHFWATYLISESFCQTATLRLA